MDKEQTEVDVKLQLRVGDVEFWKGELDNKLAQLKEEIEEAVSMKYVGVLMQPTRIFFVEIEREGPQQISETLS